MINIYFMIQNSFFIIELYPIIEPGMEVNIVNIPNKVGWRGDKLYLEAHPLLEEHDPGIEANLQDIVTAIQDKLPTASKTFIDWEYVAHLAGEPDGIPHEIGFKIKEKS